MSDLNDLNRPLTTDTEPNVLDTLRGHLIKLWTQSYPTSGKVEGMIRTAASYVGGAWTARFYRFSGTADQEITSLPGVSIGGSAASVGGLTVHTGSNNEANKIVRTDASGYLQVGYINSSNGDTNLNSAPGRIWGTNGTDSYLRTYQPDTTKVGRATRLSRRDDSSDYSVQTHWDGTRWFLRGYNGDTFHAEARVDYADAAGSLNTSRTINGTGFNGSANITTSYWGTTRTITIGATGQSVNGNGNVSWTAAQVLNGQTINEMTNSGWYRSNGAVGWYSQTYGGGIHMSDATWVRVYGSKQFYCTGLIESGNDVAAFSDERHKTDWKTLPADIIDQLARIKRHGFYRWNDGRDDKSQHIGVGAQSLQAILPQAVHQSAAGGDKLSVSYGNAALALCVELSKRVVAMQAQLDAIKKG